MIYRLLIAVLVVLMFVKPGVIFGAPPEITQAPQRTLSIDYVLPYPGILPDHPLYMLKIIRDQIVLILSRDPVRKVQIQLLLSDKRLVYSRELLDEGKPELAVSVLSKGEKYFLTGSSGIVELKRTNMLPPGLADKMELAGMKHEEVIKELIRTSPEQRIRAEFANILEITAQSLQQIASVK